MPTSSIGVLGFDNPPVCLTRLFLTQTLEDDSGGSG